jgi:hypothetical protein
MRSSASSGPPHWRARSCRAYCRRRRSCWLTTGCGVACRREITAWRARCCGGIRAEWCLAPLLAERREVGADTGVPRGGESTPEWGGVAGQSPAHCSAKASSSVTTCAVSVVMGADAGGAATRRVAAWGRRRTMVLREATKREPTLWGRGRVESSAKRRPQSGWVGSVTSTSVRSSPGGLLTGVLRCSIVRHLGAGASSDVSPAPGARGGAHKTARQVAPGGGTRAERVVLSCNRAAAGGGARTAAQEPVSA